MTFHSSACAVVAMRRCPSSAIRIVLFDTKGGIRNVLLSGWRVTGVACALGCNIKAPLKISLLRPTGIGVSRLMSVSVCLYASISPELYNPHQLLRMAVTRSSSVGVAAHYVLPVFRMTSCLHLFRHIGSHRRNSG